MWKQWEWRADRGALGLFPALLTHLGLTLPCPALALYPVQVGQESSTFILSLSSSKMSSTEPRILDFSFTEIPQEILRWQEEGNPLSPWNLVQSNPLEVVLLVGRLLYEGERHGTGSWVCPCFPVPFSELPVLGKP